MDNFNLILGVFGTGMGLLLTIWRFAIWIQNQFASLKDMVHQRVSELESKVLNKLEYHEKHDDRRFSEVHNEIWEIQVLNAAKQVWSKILVKLNLRYEFTRCWWQLHNVVFVDGTKETGLYDPSGAYNVFEVDGSVYTGLFPPLVNCL